MHQWRGPTVPTAEMHPPPPHCAHIHCLFSINLQEASTSVSGCHFFLHGGIQPRTFASATLPCQMPFCQTAPLLPSVTQEQNIKEHWQEGSTSIAISPTCEKRFEDKSPLITTVASQGRPVTFKLQTFHYHRWNIHSCHRNLNP